MNEAEKFKEQVKNLQIEKRRQLERIDNYYNVKIADLCKKHNRPPKNRATKEDIIIMVEFVLRTCVSGTKTIQLFANDFKKSDEWKKDVSQSKPKEILIEVLGNCKDFNIMKRMIENNTYCENDIVNNTLTGALKKLSNQVNTSNLIDSLRDRVKELENNLAAKNNNEDWHLKAIELRKQGLSYQKIATRLGIGKSTVADFFQKMNSP